MKKPGLSKITTRALSTLLELQRITYRTYCRGIQRRLHQDELASLTESVLKMARALRLPIVHSLGLTMATELLMAPTSILPSRDQQRAENHRLSKLLDSLGPRKPPKRAPHPFRGRKWSRKQLAELKAKGPVGPIVFNALPKPTAGRSRSRTKRPAKSAA